MQIDEQLHYKLLVKERNKWINKLFNEDDMKIESQWDDI